MNLKEASEIWPLDLFSETLILVIDKKKVSFMNRSALMTKTWKMYRASASLRMLTKFDSSLFSLMLKASWKQAPKKIKPQPLPTLKTKTEMEKLVDEYSDVIKISRF